MKCRIGQLDRCKDQGFCSWHKVFGEGEPQPLVLSKAAPTSKRRRLTRGGMAIVTDQEGKEYSVPPRNIRLISELKK